MESSSEQTESMGFRGDVGLRNLLCGAASLVHHGTILLIGHAISFVKTLSLTPASFILIVKESREQGGVDFKSRMVTSSGFLF